MLFDILSSFAIFLALVFIFCMFLKLLHCLFDKGIISDDDYHFITSTSLEHKIYLKNKKL